MIRMIIVELWLKTHDALRCSHGMPTAPEWGQTEIKWAVWGVVARRRYEERIIKIDEIKGEADLAGGW